MRQHDAQLAPAPRPTWSGPLHSSDYLTPKVALRSTLPQTTMVIRVQSVNFPRREGICSEWTLYLQELSFMSIK